MYTVDLLPALFYVPHTIFIIFWVCGCIEWSQEATIWTWNSWGFYFLDKRIVKFVEYLLGSPLSAPPPPSPRYIRQQEILVRIGINRQLTFNRNNSWRCKPNPGWRRSRPLPCLFCLYFPYIYLCCWLSLLLSKNRNAEIIKMRKYRVELFGIFNQLKVACNPELKVIHSYQYLEFLYRVAQSSLYHSNPSLLRSSFFSNNFACTSCLDINECLSSPCAPHANISCTNFQGSYQCSCAKGFILEDTNKTCIGM